MPRTKGKAKAKNLGHFALKRKRDDNTDSDEEQPQKHARGNSPIPGAAKEGSDSERSDVENSSDSETIPPHDDYDSDIDDGDDPDIEAYEEDDIPHPNTHADLIHWLELSDAHLASLHTSAAPACRGPYHSTKVGKTLSVRREQELRKAENDRKGRERREDLHLGLKNTKIERFFAQPKPTASPQNPEPEIAPDQSSFTADMDVDPPHGLLQEEPSPDMEEPAALTSNNINYVTAAESSVARASTSHVTIEVVEEDDDEDELTVEPCQLDPVALAEEGLDELPWDPSQDISPRAVDSPAPIEQPPTQVHALPPGAASYSTGEQGFTMPNRPRRWKMPSPVPSNASVDSAIKSLDEILHPRRNVGRGHKQTKLDLVTAARLECVVRFLRLYKGSNYSGWTLHSETIATASGKSGSKTWLGRKIRQWAINFCEDKTNIPNHMYGRFNASIMSDEDIAGDIHLHLQSLGKWVSAKDIVRYVATPEFQAHLSVKRKIT
ncbi:hypothetical protein B0H10DRAFT_2440552, partial [Mycena sp. CBHHK59/15]